MTQEIGHWKKAYNYNFLGDYSLEKGEELTLTIKSIGREKVKGPEGKEEVLLVAHFSEPQKPMILNKTNCKIIAKLYRTPVVEKWVGKRITIHVESVKAFGETVDAIRVKNMIPGKPTIVEGSKDWISAVDYLSKPGSKVERVLDKFEVPPGLLHKLRESAASLTKTEGVPDDTK